MLELLSPAGSMDALRAAVQNGANAVYLGSGAFNARQGAKNFTTEELAEAIRYCHIRDVAVHLAVNTLVTDRELQKVADLVRAAAAAGVDALIVQDLGVVDLCRQLAPNLPLHASTQMSIHNLEGVRKAQDLGLSRVVLARELPREEIEYICKSSPLEIEVFVHGALCMCYSGQCYMSSVIGSRSGNRGQCAQPCRLPYGYDRFDETGYPLSLKDNCLLPYLKDLERMGVASVKIEGRMKRPEYVAVTTRIYRGVLDGKPVTQRDLDTLREAFSREGFTADYYLGHPGPAMFGVREGERMGKDLIADARRTYENTETPRVPVSFYAVIERDRPAKLAVQDAAGRVCKTEGAIPQAARLRALTGEELEARLTKTGGTPYRCEQVKAVLDSGLSLSAAEINAMRREVLDRLTALRGRAEPVQLGAVTLPPKRAGQTEPPVLAIGVTSAEQITSKLLSMKPARLYVPLHLFGAENASWLSQLDPKTELFGVMPRILHNGEEPALAAKMRVAMDRGATGLLVGNLGQIQAAKTMGYRVAGDFGLNLFNSVALETAARQGLCSAAISFEASLPQIRDLSKPLPTELLVYGRLPLMLTENCVIRCRTGECSCQTGQTRLIDRTGAEFRVVRDQDTCRNVLLNSKKLYLLDKREDLLPLGLWALRLQFTTENPVEVNNVLDAWTRGGTFDQATCTRGLYIRGVQ